MKYAVYKFEFQTGAHFGTGRLNETTYVFHADQLFSALYIEALKSGVADRFYQDVIQGKLILSDGMPYVGTDYLVPKPMIYVKAEQKGVSEQKKAYKKLKYLEINQLDVFLQGKFNLLSDLMDDYGKYVQMTKASVKENADTEPYRVGTFYYNKGCGVYIIAGYEEAGTLTLFEDLLDALSFTGLGGEKSSGLGKFAFYKGKLPEQFSARLQTKREINMLLSVALPTDSELEKALEGASYLLEKRAGFVAPGVNNEAMECEEWQKKRDLYVFSAGSCFKNVFEGNIYDVSRGGHPVYRYAKAMFLGV